MFKNITALDLDVSPRHLPAFMINFEITYKCNLDCSYCRSHDNELTPSPLEKCKRSVDFILQYADTVLSLKRKHERRVALNLIGGEPFSHPDIVSILEYIDTQYKQKYQDQWKISIVVTSNGLIGERALEKVINLVDYWTISYHTETLAKQKELTLSTIKTLHSNKKNLEVRVMTPQANDKFLEAKSVHSSLCETGVNALLKPINGDQYSTGQTDTFKIFWKTKDKDQLKEYNKSSGTTCCSNRPLVLNCDRSNKTTFIPNNNFYGWYCTINLNFLFVDHLFNVYHNNHCHVSSITNQVEPVGTIDEYEKILDLLKQQIKNKSVPVIKCPKDLCIGCGMCATKSQSKEDLIGMMKNHLTDVSVLSFPS